MSLLANDPGTGRSRPVAHLGLLVVASVLIPLGCAPSVSPGAGQGDGSGGKGGSGGAISGSGGAVATGGVPGSGGSSPAYDASADVASTDATGGASGQAGNQGVSSGGVSGRAGGGGVTGTGGGGIATGGAAQAGASGTCARTTCTTCGSGQNLHNLNNDAWAGSLTLFISYSADTRNQTVNKGYTAAQWNAAVNSFNVPSFAAQVQATGAKNILLMLGQNTGYYNSPNAAYEKFAGVAPGTRCSTRDLPMEIADALAAKGIGMYLYLPEDVGWGDTKAANSFGLSALAVGNWVVDSTFTPKWNEVVKTWADRYRSKVKGWFFDGYEIRWGVTEAMARTYRNTCLAANPCGVVTFNGGGSNAVSDTQRGETRIDPATGLPAKGLPTSRWDRSGLQVMWDFPLQAAWGQEIADDSPAIYSNVNLKTFITAAIKAQAVFALDVRTSLAGKLSVPIYNQLLAIKQ